MYLYVYIYIYVHEHVEICINTHIHKRPLQALLESNTAHIILAHTENGSFYEPGSHITLSRSSTKEYRRVSVSWGVLFWGPCIRDPVVLGPY